MEQHELSKVEFDLIDEGLKTPLDSGPDPKVARKNCGPAEHVQGRLHGLP